MPNLSSFSSAYSRHSARTSHPRQTRLASRVEPPFSGKNASGSVCAQSARSCQPTSSTSSGRTTTCVSGTMTSVKAHPPLVEPPIAPRPSRDGENHTNEIAPACLASRQAKKVVLAPWLSNLRGKFFKKLRSAHASPPSGTSIAVRPRRGGGGEGGGGGGVGGGTPPCQESGAGAP